MGERGYIMHKDFSAKQRHEDAQDAAIRQNQAHTHPEHSHDTASEAKQDATLVELAARVGVLEKHDHVAHEHDVTALEARLAKVEAHEHAAHDHPHDFVRINDRLTALEESGANGSGPKGDKGLTGDKGDTGSQGVKGDKGEQGSVGPTGERGERGELGVTGPQGAQGDVGLQGVAGVDGKDGLPGEVGRDGLQGERGERGEQGERGLQGPVFDHTQIDLDHAALKQEMVDQEAREKARYVIFETKLADLTLRLDNLTTSATKVL